jgi:hypothetical protein
VSTAAAFLSSGKLLNLTGSLLQAHGSDSIVSSIVDALARQTCRANPFAAITPASGFVSKTRLGAERVTAMRTDDLCHFFHDLQILGGRDAPQRLSRDKHSILKSLPATGTQ